MAKKKQQIWTPLNIVFGVFFLTLAFIALQQQLRRPEAERTWQGTILGIPYDFRFPTLENLRQAFWNEKTPQVFLPKPAGLGWSINLYPILHPQED